MSVGDRGRATGEENVMFYRTVVGISTLLGGYCNHIQHQGEEQDGLSSNGGGVGIHVLCAV